MLKELIFMSGLPNSSSTVLRNILATHPEIASTPSSPLCHIAMSAREVWSNDQFLLTQLDGHSEEVLERLERTFKAMLMTYSDQGKPITVDANRGWLSRFELLRTVFPDVRFIVTIRDLRSVYASCVLQDRRTKILSTPNTGTDVVQVTSRQLFASPGGVIGGPLLNIDNLTDIPNVFPEEDERKHIYLWRAEDFSDDPKQAVADLLEWIGVEPMEINFKGLPQVFTEADSYWRLKYRHVVRPEVAPATEPDDLDVSPRVMDWIIEAFRWYYDQFYPEALDELDAKKVADAKKKARAERRNKRPGGKT